MNTFNNRNNDNVSGVGNTPLNAEYTPDRITMLGPNDIFVFGSNLAGQHAGGAARIAFNRFGAVWGEGEGLFGNTYAIPTMQGGVETIQPYVDRFIDFASKNGNLTFYVTKIGCGIAGFRYEEIAPLFKQAYRIPNIRLPKEFHDILYLEANPIRAIIDATYKKLARTDINAGFQPIYAGRDYLEDNLFVTRIALSIEPSADRNASLNLNVYNDKTPYKAQSVLEIGDKIELLNYLADSDAVALKIRNKLPRLAASLHDTYLETNRN